MTCNAKSCSNRARSSDTIRTRYLLRLTNFLEKFQKLSYKYPGVGRSWKRLLDGCCGIVSLRDQGAAFAQQQCQVAGLVPSGKKENGGWTVGEWMSKDVCEIKKSESDGEGGGVLMNTLGATKNLKVYAICPRCF